MRTWPLRALTLLCAVLFLVSAFMTGTYAWQSEQRALNNVYGSKTVLVPVDLIKLEKQADETTVEIPIPGTVFYLFREDGSQLGGRYVTDENGKISVLLSAGKYYFEEVSPSIGYTYDTDESGNQITRYPFTVTDEDEQITVKAYNIRLNGDLLIRKTVENTDGAPLTDMQKKTLFTFTVTFSDGGTYAYRIDNGEEKLLESGGTLQLSNGQTAVFEELPVGVLYTVTETPVTGYTTTATGHRGTITDTQSVAEFINLCEQDKLGSLIVTKEVRGENADLDYEFTFVATLGGVTEVFTLKHGEIKEFVGIPVHTDFIVTEQDASQDGYFATVEGYAGEIVGTETVVLPFVNIYDPPTDQPGRLTVQKEVIGEDADPDKVFTFEVIFTGAGAPESRTFFLKAGEKLTIEDIPHGVGYTVFEIDSAGYWPVLEQSSGTIVGGTESFVIFNNRVPTEETGSLTVTKEVKGENADPDKTFTFTAKIGDETYTFLLRDGESKTFAGLPVGTIYTVTEADSPDDLYFATVTEYNGQIVDSQNVLLPFVNIFDPPTDQPGRLSVNKVVLGDNADADKVFTFTVTFSDGGTYAYRIGDGEEQLLQSGGTLQLRGGETAVFEELPHGVSYTVVETDAAGYDPLMLKASGTIVGGQYAVVTFINKAPEQPENTVKLTVQKLLAGEYMESDKDRLFNITLIIDGKVTSFTLKADEIKEFDVPVGAIYEVREEDYIADGFSQSIVNGAGTVGDQPIAVTVTNTYVGDPRVEIGGDKTWNMNGHTDVKLPESITVQLMNGDRLVEEKIVEPDADGQWRYLFVAPKYNPDGSLAEYTLKELPITNYRVEYKGYDIINTYVQPIQVDPPIITKVVMGDKAPSTPFEFIFTGQHGTPMPEGSEGYRKTLFLTGAGELEIGTITFTEPGEYVYTVHEKNGGAKGWGYDTALYTITFTVTEKDHVLTAKRTIVKNGVNTEHVVFTNTFGLEDGTYTLISGVKTWEHGANPEATRPDAIVVKVYGDGKLVTQRRVTAENSWQYAFELPRFAADGHEIVYTVDEDPVKDYRKRIDGYDLINSYIGTPDVSGSLDGSTPDTGDNANLTFWFTLMLVSLLGFIATMMFSRRRYAYVGKHFRHPIHDRRPKHYRRPKHSK